MKSVIRRRKTTLLTYLSWVALAFLTVCSSAHARWWNGEWSIRKKITLDTTSKDSGIANPIGTAVVLIRLHDGNFQFAGAKDDGSDLRFVAADDKTLLTYHIEKYDSLLSEAFVWVKVPDVKAGTQTSFWLYYGNGDSKATKAEDAKATYDPDTVLAYHFAEHGVPANDLTTFGNNAQNAGIAVDGSMVGTGLRLDGHSGITIPGSPSLSWKDGATFTWWAWIKPSALQPNAVIFSRRDGTNAFVIGVDNGIPFVEVTASNGAQRSQADRPLVPNEWRHLAVVAAGSKITLFLDGEPYATVNASVPALNSPAIIGMENTSAPADAANPAGFLGELDELEISRVARSPDYIQFAAFIQGGDKASKLLSFGADEQTSSWLSGGYFGIIIKSLTADGWVVIGILMIMAAISWLVMINKASYLNGIRKGNNLFLKEWRHISSDLTVLDHGNAAKVKTMGGRVDLAGQRAMRNASVYRIYHIGAEEIRHRLAGHQNGDAKVLSQRSIEAIRAMLDASLVRETQKLNRLMVLLTIAISGGPFLGLFGTVVGVMITFAAIAAAGDVNVNAIAPGIAAALVATVAGLAVAIPALFGYNYLISCVKDATSDMHVFIDEFVTRMAEFYSEPAVYSGGKVELVSERN